ncbi:MAG TPA: hypothetical protein VLF95_05430 [Vicinamibacteria bacterium]|nr:hypothetical protein [Vicinamibacteria bacterium]
MRKLSQREKGLLGLLAVAAVALSAWALRHSDAAPAVLGRPAPEKPLPPVPRIALARVDTPRAETPAGRRDLFAFGAAREPEEESAPPLEVARPAAGTAGPAGGAGSTPGDAVASGPVVPSLPPLNLHFIGSVENKAGVKVAVLLTDRKEVLTGQAGQVVANRYRIARIGLESVDLEDVGSGQSRRIPLKGN